jgi:hypothetical protein
MSADFTKRVASVFIDDAQPKQSLKELTAESRKLYNELARLPRGTAEFAAKAKELRSVRDQIKEVRSQIDGTNTVLGKVKSTLGPMAGLMGLTFGAGAVMGALKKSRDAFLEHERAVAKLEATLRSTGNAAGLTAEELMGMADSLNARTLFGAEEIIEQSTNRLLTYTNIQGETFARAQQAALDMAAALGGNLAGAAETVGKALGSPLHAMGALAKQGFRFTEDQKEQIQTLLETGRTAEAQAIILEELELAYAGQAEAAARSERGMRELDAAMGVFVRGPGGLLNEMLNDLAGGFASVLNTMADWLGLTQRGSDQVQKQRVEMNALFNVLKGGNLTTDQHKQLVAQINREYGDYLPQLISVSDSTEALAAAQKAANVAMLEQIRLMARKELLEEAQKRAVDAEREALEANLKLQRAIQGDVSLWDRLKASQGATGEAVGYLALRSAEAASEAEKASEEYQRMVEQLGTVEQAQRDAGTTTDDLRNRLQKLRELRQSYMDLGKEAAATEGDAEIARLEAVIARREEMEAEAGEEESERARKIREELAKARKDIEMDRLDGYAKERQQVIDHYEDMAARAEGSGVDLAEIENQKQEALLNVRRKYAQRDAERMQKLDEEIRKISLEQATARMDALHKAEVEAINQRYIAAREAALAGEGDLAAAREQYQAELFAAMESNEQQRHEMAVEREQQRIRDRYEKLLTDAKGNAERRAKLEELMAFELEQKAIEMEAEEDERRAEREKTRAELLAKVREEVRDEELRQMEARHERELEMAELHGMQLEEILRRQAEEREPYIQEQREAEIAALDAHYQTLYEQMADDLLAREELERQHQRAMELLRAQHAQQDVEMAEEKDRRIIESMKARADAEKAIRDGIVELSYGMFNALAEAEGEYSAFSKIAALYQIAVDTAAAISSLTAASEANPANAVTFGGAGIAQFVAGILRIATNMARAATTLNKQPPKPPAFAVGGATGPHIGTLPAETDVIRSYFDDALGVPVSITRTRNISSGGPVQQPTIGVFGEAGSEWVGPNWMYQHPDLRPVFDALESIRQRGSVPQFAAGGPSLPQAPTSAAPVAAPASSSEASEEVLLQLSTTVQQLNDILGRGITAVMSYELQREAEARQIALEEENNIT